MSDTGKEAVSVLVDLLSVAAYFQAAAREASEAILKSQTTGQPIDWDALKAADVAARGKQLIAEQE